MYEILRIQLIIIILIISFLAYLWIYKMIPNNNQDLSTSVDLFFPPS